ncbi:hypothetical protein JCM8202_000115 [Rhodotorula sphaerocarpa]
MLGPSQSEAQKPTQRPHAGRLPGAAATHGRPRRHSLLGPRGPAIDKENAPTATKEAGAGTKQKPAVAEVEAKKKGAPKALDVSVAVKSLTRSAATGGATSTPLARKSTSRKAFQSSISPLVHFDDPAAVASTFSTRSATAGRSASGATAASQQSPHQSPPPQKTPVQHQPSLAAGPVVPAFYNQTSLPPSLTNSGLELGPAGPYYLPSFDLPFLQQSAQGHHTPPSPGTPGPPTPMGPTSPAVSTDARSLYPSSLGLGHPYLVAPSVSSSLSLSSVPSIFSTPGSAPESRNTSFGSVAPEATPLVYPIPYAYVVNDAPPRRSSRATIRQRLEGGEIIDSKGSVKFFDVERGFGFIIDDNAEELGADVFVHYTGIEQLRGFRCLAQHERVEYVLVKHTSGRFQALKLRGEHGAPLKGLGDPRQAAAFDRMNRKAAIRWSEDEEDTRPPPRFQGRNRRIDPDFVKGSAARGDAGRERTPVEEEEEEAKA